MSGSFWCRVDRRPSVELQVFVSDVIRPKEARHGAIFAIMEYANANERNHGTNTIAEVICHGDKLAQS